MGDLLVFRRSSNSHRLLDFIDRNSAVHSLQGTELIVELLTPGKDPVCKFEVHGNETGEDSMITEVEIASPSLSTLPPRIERQRDVVGKVLQQRFLCIFAKEKYKHDHLSHHCCHNPIVRILKCGFWRLKYVYN